jgi:hypothetical protein
MKGKWVVEVKGRPEEGHFEISIIRENNVQGEQHAKNLRQRK